MLSDLSKDTEDTEKIQGYLAPNRTPLKLFTFIGVPLALYQVTSGFIFSSVVSNSFNSWLTLNGFLSLALLGTALAWVISASDYNEKEFIMSSKKKERLSTVIYLTLSLLKLTGAPILLSNLFFQKNYLLDHLIALNRTAALLDASVVEQPQSLGAFQSMLAAYLCFEIALFFYSVLSSITAFKLIQSPKRFQSKLINTSNAILLVSSLALLFNIDQAFKMQGSLRPEAFFPSWNTRGLFILGSFCSLLTFGVWLVNHKKSHKGFSVLAYALLSASTLMLLHSGFAFSNTYDIYRQYSDHSEAENWRVKMALVSQKQIQEYGCPSKYLPSDKCENNLLMSTWEAPNPSENIELCLNKHCAVILGQLYADKFLPVANWSLITGINMMLLASSLFYSSKTRGNQLRNNERKTRKKNFWLGFLGTIWLSCLVIYCFSPISSVEEFDASNPINQEIIRASSLGYLEERQDLIPQIPINFGLEKQVALKIAQMTQFKEYRYIILEPDLIRRTMNFVKQGLLKEKYKEMIDNLDTNKAQLVLIRIPIDGKERLITILWIPITVPALEAEVIMEIFNPNYLRVSFHEILKCPVIVAEDKDDLQFSMLEEKIINFNRKYFMKLNDEYMNNEYPREAESNSNNGNIPATLPSSVMEALSWDDTHQIVRDHDREQYLRAFGSKSSPSRSSSPSHSSSEPSHSSSSSHSSSESHSSHSSSEPSHSSSSSHSSTEPHLPHSSDVPHLPYTSPEPHPSKSSDTSTHSSLQSSNKSPSSPNTSPHSSLQPSNVSPHPSSQSSDKSLTSSNTLPFFARKSEKNYDDYYPRDRYRYRYYDSGETNYNNLPPILDSNLTNSTNSSLLNSSMLSPLSNLPKYSLEALETK